MNLTNAAIFLFPTIKLNESKYDFWKFNIQTYLGSTGFSNTLIPIRMILSIKRKLVRVFKKFAVTVPIKVQELHGKF
jgi:hypothetical protein